MNTICEGAIEHSFRILVSLTNIEALVLDSSCQHVQCIQSSRYFPRNQVTTSSPEPSKECRSCTTCNKSLHLYLNQTSDLLEPPKNKPFHAQYKRAGKPPLPYLRVRAVQLQPRKFTGPRIVRWKTGGWQQPGHAMPCHARTAQSRTLQKTEDPNATCNKVYKPSNSSQFLSLKLLKGFLDLGNHVVNVDRHRQGILDKRASGWKRNHKRLSRAL